MAADQIGVDAVTHDILKNAILLGRPEAIEAAPVEIGDAGHEGKAERMAECEDEITDPAAIDVVTDNVETGVGFEKRVEHMFARRGGDDLRMEGCVTAEDRGVELDDRIGAVAAVDAACDFAAIAEMNMLTVGRGNGMRSEHSRERSGVLGFDHAGERQREGLFPEVPDRHLL